MRMIFFAAIISGFISGSAPAEQLFLSGENLHLSSWGVSKVGEGIGKWYTNQASAWWEFDVPKAGEFHLFLRVSGSAETAGSTVQIEWNRQPLKNLIMPDTGGLENYELMRLTDTPIQMPAGIHQLRLHCDQLKGKELGGFGMGVLTDHETLTEIPNYHVYINRGSFADTLTGLKTEVPEMGSLSLFRLNYKALWNDYPHEMVWFTQDMTDLKTTNMNPQYDYARDVCGYFDSKRDTTLERGLIERVLSELKGDPLKKYRKTLNRLTASNAGPESPEWLKLYLASCKERRKIRMAPLLEKTERLIYAKHQVFGSRSGIYNTTEYEGLHDGEKSSLNVLDLSPERQGRFAESSVLKDAEGGILRDPAVSPDGTKILYSWRKTSEHKAWPDTQGAYKIYEMDWATQKSRPLTSDETYGADYEPCYLPNGDILFNSSRIVQVITCGWGDHSNLFLMNKDGKFQRRIGFDQVSTQFPTMLNNGQIVYLRRDYNDRGQVAAHALFVMNQDGTSQTEYYGNQTGTPNSLMHPAPIPGSHKILCVLSGYHTRQGGMLASVDVREGRNHGKGVTLIPQGVPPESSPGHDDGYGKLGVQFANPLALSETEFVVCRSETWDANKSGRGSNEKYGIYFMTADGRRELLANDVHNSCLQPVLLKARTMPPSRPSVVDYTQKSGTYYVQNVYEGAAAAGITNRIAKLRVIELLYKHDTIKWGRAHGPGGSEHSVTAPAHPLALFDAKRIIGDATVYQDGSAMFEVPACTPVYFQLLDEKNRCVQTMRSWSTLMPNEHFSCVGCHEDKNDTPLSNKKTLAMTHGVEILTPFYGAPRGFSFLKEVQPIFDKNCVRCHQEGKAGEKLLLTAEPFVDAPDEGRRWAQSYYRLMAARPGPDPSVYTVKGGPELWNRRGPAQADEPNRYVTYGGRLARMDFFPPYTFGAVKSGLIQRLEQGHHGVKISAREWDTLAAWIDLNCPYCGNYMEGNIWSEKQVRQYQARIAERKRNDAINAEAVRNYIQAGQPN